MSNLSDKTEDQNKSKQRWSAIKTDLQLALDDWAELEKQRPALSPDEEQLVKIKSIIGQLKEKLENF